MPTKRLNATLVASYPITERVKQFLLRVEGHTFDFTPGQHVSVAAEQDGEKRIYRPYSPVNQPGTDTIALAVKRYRDGTGSSWMHNRTPGDTISFMPPSGNLQLHDPSRDVVFLATGTGLTPMLSILGHYLREGEGKALLLFGERTEEDLMYRDTLDLLNASHDNLSIEYVLSKEDWNGRTGYVQDHLTEVIEDVTTPHFFICGVPEMVVDTKGILDNMGAPEEHVFSEGWEEGAVDE